MPIQTIAARQLDACVGKCGFVILDLRNAVRYRMGHIKGAVNIPFVELEERLDTLPQADTYLCYCERGGASLMAARILDRAGLRAVSVSGGLAAYRGKYLERD